MRTLTIEIARNVRQAYTGTIEVPLTLDAGDFTAVEAIAEAAYRANPDAFTPGDVYEADRDEGDDFGVLNVFADSAE